MVLSQRVFLTFEGSFMKDEEKKEKNENIFLLGARKRSGQLDSCS